MFEIKKKENNKTTTLSKTKDMRTALKMLRMHQVNNPSKDSHVFISQTAKSQSKKQNRNPAMIGWLLLGAALWTGIYWGLILGKVLLEK